MVHTYKITGMTCTGCEAKIKSALLQLNNVIAVEVSGINNTANVSMDKHISIATLQQALGSKYTISAPHHNEIVEQGKGWLATYKPVLLIFLYITGITLLLQMGNAQFDSMQWMRHFMAAFFLVFSFFKMLDLKAFAESYAMYDVIARKIPVWGYAYALIELLLGIAFVINYNPLVTNLVTAVVMMVSIIGVLQTVLNKKKIQCACLGAVFNLPMSTVTIIEDALMILMSIAMIFML